MDCSTIRLLCPSISPRVCSDSWPLIESLMPSNHLIPCCPLLLLPSILPSIRVFSNESTLCMRQPKYWSFSFSISPFQWIFRVDFHWNWLVWYPCCPRDSPKFPPAPQLESINSLVLSLLYGPIHIHTWLLEKNSKFFQILCRQRAPHTAFVTDVTAFDLEMLISCSRWLAGPQSDTVSLHSRELLEGLMRVNISVVPQASSSKRCHTTSSHWWNVHRRDLGHFQVKVGKKTCFIQDSKGRQCHKREEVWDPAWLK